MLSPLVMGTLLLQATPDSAALARLRERIEGQDLIRVEVGSDQLELTRPSLRDTLISYRAAWSDEKAGQDAALANPLPLSQVSVLQVRGKQVLPSVLGGSLSAGISALASMLLTRTFNSNSGIDGNDILRVTALALSAGAVVGAADGALRTRWVVAWRRESSETDTTTGTDGDGQNRQDGNLAEAGVDGTLRFDPPRENGRGR